MARHNASLPEARAHHAINLGGIGVHAGGPVVVEKAAGHVRGAVASMAYFIGEELCSGGSILVSAPAVAALEKLEPSHAHRLRSVAPEE